MLSKMAFQQFVCGFALMTILLCRGCHSQPPACMKAVTNGRIVGGQEASPGSWPWQAALNMDGSFFCGGSLITDQWVLTAAHCITPSDLLSTVVHLGRQTLTGVNPNEVTRSLDNIICHPQYDSTTNENDVCLLKLSSRVTFTDFIQPVCLASSNSTFFDGTSSWVTGFGVTDSGSQPETLQEVEVPIVGNNRCRCNYRDSTDITENMICAGLKNGGKDSCQGDSGGPLVSKKDYYWVQSGVVSFGIGCGLALRPGVYARVSRYENWISNTVTGTAPGFISFISTGPNDDLNFSCSTSSLTTTTPTTTTTTPFTTTTTAVVSTTDDSIFSGGENLIQFTQFLSLFISAFIFHIFFGSG